MYDIIQPQATHLTSLIRLLDLLAINKTEVEIPTIASKTSTYRQFSDPDSIKSVDPYPDSESGSGSRRAKWPMKIEKKFRNVMFWSSECSLLRAEGFSCSLDVLYGGLGISKLQFWFLKKFCCKLFQFLVIKTLVSDWYSAKNHISNRIKPCTL